jgi:tricarballylate dehydrogenase
LPLCRHGQLIYVRRLTPTPIGARPAGHWSGCHAVAWDINAPPYGDLAIGDQFQKHNYPFGILINAKGERYLDEGANFHSHTYAKADLSLALELHERSYGVFERHARVGTM